MKDFLREFEITVNNLCHELADSPVSLRNHLNFQQGYLFGYVNGKEWGENKEFSDMARKLQEKMDKL